jgi:hypothetical protein
VSIANLLDSRRDRLKADKGVGSARFCASRGNDQCGYAAGKTNCKQAEPIHEHSSPGFQSR